MTDKRITLGKPRLSPEQLQATLEAAVIQGTGRDTVEEGMLKILLTLVEGASENKLPAKDKLKAIRLILELMGMIGKPPAISVTDARRVYLGNQDPNWWPTKEPSTRKHLTPEEFNLKYPENAP